MAQVAQLIKYFLVFLVIVVTVNIASIKVKVKVNHVLRVALHNSPKFPVELPALSFSSSKFSQKLLLLL